MTSLGTAAAETPYRIIPKLSTRKSQCVTLWSPVRNFVRCLCLLSCFRQFLLSLVSSVLYLYRSFKHLATMEQRSVSSSHGADSRRQHSYLCGGCDDNYTSTPRPKANPLNLQNKIFAGFFAHGLVHSPTDVDWNRPQTRRVPNKFIAGCRILHVSYCSCMVLGVTQPNTRLYFPTDELHLRRKFWL